MDTKELLKKYWFVGAVGVLLVVFIGMYTINYVKSLPVTVNTKKVDGNYVVYSIDDQNVTADELYDQLYETYGLSSEMLAYEKMIFNNAYETTKEMQENATQMASAYLSYYDESTLLSTLKSTGYKNGLDDLPQYIIDSNKQQMLVREFVLANQEKYLAPQMGDDGRVIYHILVKVNDIEEVKDENGDVIEYKANPTEEESKKLETILNALKTTQFEQVAYTYSDDSSKSNGGYIGLINSDNKANYYQTFADAAMVLEEGSVSDPIISQAGYHILYNAGSTAEKALNDYYFLNQLEQSNPILTSAAIFSKGKELNIVVNSETLKNYIETIESEAE